jgi:hypothetical protein
MDSPWRVSKALIYVGWGDIHKKGFAGLIKTWLVVNVSHRAMSREKTGCGIAPGHFLRWGEFAV